MKTSECIHLLKALADETRWRIVNELLGEALTVNDLVKRLGVSQYNVSKHLRILREVGIVAAKRHGRCIECHIQPNFRRRLSQGVNPPDAAPNQPRIGFPWQGVTETSRHLDLGCCVFHFDTVGK